MDYYEITILLKLAFHISIYSIMFLIFLRLNVSFIVLFGSFKISFQATQ